ncbi:hypothetical protein DP923_05040 [Pontibacter arcticus]|uniref:Uncharacterized protein n=1 Tax=Pontibacter arcticus TaxID=2080288 RepID=A0A364RJF2_9BACT|nr:hypothetical protein DP923_05040 [Pontibacter arcticus]
MFLYFLKKKPFSVFKQINFCGPCSVFHQQVPVGESIVVGENTNNGGLRPVIENSKQLQSIKTIGKV